MLSGCCQDAVGYDQKWKIEKLYESEGIKPKLCSYRPGRGEIDPCASFWVFGRPWPAMAGHGRLRLTMGGQGRSWSAKAGHGQPCLVMAGHGRMIWQLVIQKAATKMQRGEKLPWPAIWPDIWPAHGKPMGRPLGRPMSRPLGRPLGRPMGRPFGRPLGRPCQFFPPQYLSLIFVFTLCWH